MNTGHFDLINSALAAGRAAAKAQGIAVGGAIWGSHRCCKLARTKDGSVELMATPGGAWILTRVGVGRIADGQVVA